MARRRAIDPDLFDHIPFRRASYIQRELWIALIAKCADDEGRFEAEPMCLLEVAFSRSHDATEDDIRDALAYWQKAGWLLLYGENGCYGFLTGWYEHQLIRDPDPSNVPPPPLLVSSWSDAQKVKVWHTKDPLCKKNVHYKTVLAKFAAAVETRPALSEEVLGEKCALSTKKVRTKHAASVALTSPHLTSPHNDKGKGIAGAGAPAAPEDPPATPEPPAPARRESPQQQAANTCLALFGIDHTDLSRDEAAPYYKAMNSLIAHQAGGAAEVQAWAEAEAAIGQRTLGVGAKPEKAIPAAVRKGVSAKGWQTAFADARQKVQVAGQKFILREDGTRLYEKDWTAIHLADVNSYRAGGWWDDELGMAYNDKRHPTGKRPEA